MTILAAALGHEPTWLALLLAMLVGMVAVTRRASRYQAEAGFLKVARELARAGYDMPTEVWLAGVVQWLASGKRDVIVRKGRGARGSTTMCIWALSHALCAPWKRRPGTITVGVVMSNSLANGRDIVAKLRDMCERLKVPHEGTSERIRLLEHPWEFRLYAAQPNAALGIEIGIVLTDEADAMQADSGANPLRLIVERLTPRMRDPQARMVIMSAPYDYEGYFAERVALGDTEAQAVLHVPTWEGNPEETEESCRSAAIDETHFLQAFAAEPQEHTARRPFKKDDINFALSDNLDRGTPIGGRVVACDASSGTGGDAFVWLVAGVNQRSDGTLIVCVDLADGEFGKWAHKKGGGEVIARLAQDAHACGATEVHSDQREVQLMRTECPRHNLRVVVHTHSTDSKASGVERLQLWLESGLLALPRRNGERIRRQLLDYQESSTRTGLKRFGGRGKRADDFVAALVTLALAEQSGALEGSRNARPPRNDPPPYSGSPLKSWNQVHDTPHPIDRITFDTFGRAIASRPKSPLDGGGF